MPPHMRIFTRATMIAVTLTALPLVSASAQLREDLARRPVEAGSIRTLPNPATQKAQIKIQSVLRDVPDDMLTIMQEPDWPNPKRKSGALGVDRVGTPMRLCRQPSDKVDLRRIRANGFQVVSYQLTDGTAPKGYTVAGYSNVRPYKHASPNRDQLLNAHDPAEIDTISITPQVWVLDMPVLGKKQRMGCVSNWSLEIRVVGPRGVSPYTGKPQ